MSAQTPRRRRSAGPPAHRTVKTSLIVGVDLHARWAAAAALRGMDRNAYAVEVLAESLKGLVIMDRRKSAGPVALSSDEDRPDRG